MAKQMDRARVIGASKVDQPACQWGIQVELPSVWKWSPRGSLLGTPCVASAMRPDILRRVPIELRQTGEGEALPYLGLPKGVESLDGVLQPVFQGWGEYRSHPERPAKAADPADGVGELMSALEPGVVVELSISGQTHSDQRSTRRRTTMLALNWSSGQALI
jgi:hypothetical protein